MTAPISPPGATPTGAGSRVGGRVGPPPVGATDSGLESPQGKTTIADAVVSKVAGIAARQVPGVRGFGGGAARAFGAITERIPGSRASSAQGVSVEVGEVQAAVDLTIVVEYGVAIAELARAIRRNVVGAIEEMTGLQVVEVNIDVVDLHLPQDDDQDDRRPQAPAQPTHRVR